MTSELNEAKQKLLDKLGPNYNPYIQLLGKWFRGMISKGEFDKCAKSLVEQNFVLEHNKFWLAFFHHCANSSSKSIQSHNFKINDAIGDPFSQTTFDQDRSGNSNLLSPDSISPGMKTDFSTNGNPRVRCLPNKVITHMKIFVIAWEMGLDSVDDHVSLYINLALQHFLKNIITDIICTKTAYRLRENRFKHAIGVKPMNPYLNNSLKVYCSYLEYDPYQIESNKMNSSLVDTYTYNDSLFPSRLYEAQALYEYACSTTDITPVAESEPKKLKLSNPRQDQSQSVAHSVDGGERRLTLYHLLIAFLTNRTIIPSQSLYSINLERIFIKITN